MAIELVAEGKRKGVTQRQLAAAMGVGAPQLTYYVTGKRGSVTMAHLLGAAERLGIDPEVIVERAYDALGAWGDDHDEIRVIEVDVEEVRPRPRSHARRPDPSSPPDPRH